ncbi:hypothetical protein AVEN_12917-1 [Araneus ventricosus]|uniref:Uncharacterized protein n=1 Tax=Araneus ventricosus TaxID=182803 RepID=A0A4Y2IV87_ARAVE|nr:hypothetical protein AVEN_12917-1 [Araneus ventricosus]
MLLDVSMCLAVWSNDSGINIDPKILCPEDMFQPTTSYNTCRRPFFSSFGPKEKKHYCAAAHCRPLCRIREKNLRYYGAKTPSQCRSLCKATICVCPLNRRQRRPAYVGQENTVPGPDSNGLLYSLQTSPDSHWRAIQGVC